MSKAEDILELHLKADKINYSREIKAIPNRDFRFDFYCDGIEIGKFGGEGLVEERKPILVEVQGGAWMKPVLGNDGKYHSRGAHGTGKSQERDCEKLSLAAVHGYRTIVVTPAQIKSGKAIEWIKAALA